MTGETTLGSWLDVRLSGVEKDLARRIEDCVSASSRAVPLRDAAEGLATDASASLRRLLRSGCEARSSALDLLAIDALVTYACEIAATESSDVARTAAFLIREVAGSANAGGASIASASTPTADAAIGDTPIMNEPATRTPRGQG